MQVHPPSAYLPTHHNGVSADAGAAPPPRVATKAGHKQVPDLMGPVAAVDGGLDPRRSEHIYDGTPRPVVELFHNFGRTSASCEIGWSTGQQ